MVSSFQDFIRVLGIVPPQDIVPGQWHRCATLAHPRKKNGSIKLTADERAGFAIAFDGDGETHVWRPRDAAIAEQHAVDAAEITERLRLRRDSERAGTLAALAHYNAATPLLHAAHPYLQTKRIEVMHGCHGLRVDATGALLVPMLRNGSILSVQRIAIDGSKLFASGAPTKGAIWPLERPNAPVTVLCEGLATGVTIFAALASATVLVCFSSANLVAVASELNLSGLIAVAADNDTATAARIGKNPGREAGNKAAEIIGCGCAYPNCAGSDWNDDFVERLERMELAAIGLPQFLRIPQRLRASALAPVAASIMSAAIFVPHKN